MYKYKREINKKDDLKNSSFLISNNNDVVCSLMGDFSSNSPYNGIYINKNKVLVDNIAEEIDFKNNTYKVSNIDSLTVNTSSDDYIESVDLNNNIINYEIDSVSYSKEIILDSESDVLIINYFIQNNKNCNIKFRVVPLITDRLFNEIKTSQLLKFSQRKLSSGAVINLSVHDNRNLYILSNGLKYDKENDYIKNVKKCVKSEELEDKISTQDLFIPGILETTIKKNESKNINVIISTKVKDIGDIDLDNIKEKYYKKQNEVVQNIPEEFQELRDLALGMEQISLKNGEICSYPYELDLDYIYNKKQITIEELLKYIFNITEYTKAIDGRFIVLKKEKEAVEELIKVEKIIKDIEKINITDGEVQIEIIKLKLWYIEILNKLMNYQDKKISEESASYIKSIVFDLLKDSNQKLVLKNIETIALLFNAVKICKHMLDNTEKEEELFYKLEASIKEFINDNFWSDKDKCMKENVTDKIATPNVSMIYTLSLSYPCVVGENSIKLLDTIFKTLYTPYGLRITPKNSNDNKGLIYPKYIAHFIKANLRQNGITRASKKISYNLVKELLMDVSKKVSGGIPMVYNENGLIINDVSYDLFTNAEIIRLYDMLT